MKKSLSLLLLVIAFALPAMAQEQSLPRIAVAHGDTLNLYVNGALTPISTTHAIRYDAVWSPDGKWLAFKQAAATNGDTQYNETLAVTDGAMTVELAIGAFNTGYPLSWSPDGTMVVYATPLPATDFAQKMQLWGVVPVAGAQAQLIGEFEVGTGCGGGSMFPSDWAYFEETTLGGTREVLQLTPFGLVYTAKCVGNDTVLFNLQTGEMTFLAGGGMTHAVVSPDGTRVAGVKDEQLVTIQLATMEAVTVQPVAPPDQLIWTPRGAILYSARIQTGNLVDGLSDGMKQAINANVGYELTDVPKYEVVIVEVDPAGFDGRTVYRSDAYAIGRMALTPDEATLVFSQIPNMDKWLAGMADGSINMNSENGWLDAAKSTPTELYTLPFVSVPGTPTQFLGADMRQFAMSPVQ